jgi:hypothetical protein
MYNRFAVRIRNDILRKQTGIQNLLTELGEKQLQWSGHVKRMYKQEYQEGH